MRLKWSTMAPLREPQVCPRSFRMLSVSNAHVQPYLGDTNTTYNSYVPKENGYTWDVFEYDCANDMIKTLPVNTKEW